MICPECNGTGKTVYFVEVGRDEKSVTCEKREDICRTCKGSGEKPMTNADKIRAMDDETLASQFTQVFCEGVDAITGITLPDEILNELRSEILKKLKEPAEEQNECQRETD